MRKRQVVITGYGAVSSCHGQDGAEPELATVKTDLGAGASALALRTRKVRAIGAEHFLDDNRLRRTDRFSQMAIVATELALRESGLKLEGGRSERSGVVFNTCFGPLMSTETYVHKLLKEGPRKVPAAIFPYTVQNAFTGLVTTHLRALGTNSTICGSNSAAYGFDAIQQDTDDVMVVGGCEELTPSLVRGLRYGPRASARNPMFAVVERQTAGGMESDVDLVGLGEGAAVVILEEEQHALARHARPIARIVEYGSQHAPLQNGGAPEAVCAALTVAMQQALSRAGFDADSVDLFVAGAEPGVYLGHLEAEVARRVFGNKHPKTVYPAQQCGNTLGASGIFNLLTACEEMWGEGASRGSAGSKDGGIRRALISDVQFGGSITVLSLERYAAATNG